MRERERSDSRVIRVWIAVFSSDEGTGYGVTFGAHHPENSHQVSDIPLTALEAEYLAVKGALQAVPRELALSIACFTAQGHVDLAFNLQAWKQQGWAFPDGSTILGKTTLSDVCDALDTREGAVHWRIAETGQRHPEQLQLWETLRVGIGLLRQRAPPPPLSEGVARGRHATRTNSDRCRCLGRGPAAI